MNFKISTGIILIGEDIIKKNQVLGQCIDDLVVSKNRKHKSDAIAKTKKTNTGDIISFTAQRYKSNGESIFVQATIVPILIDAQLLCHFGIYTDRTAEVSLVSDQKLLIKKRTRELESLFETMGEAVFVENTIGIITYVNTATIELLGFSKEFILGKNFLFFVAQSQQNLVNCEIEKREEGNYS